MPVIIHPSDFYRINIENPVLYTYKTGFFHISPSSTISIIKNLA